GFNRARSIDKNDGCIEYFEKVRELFDSGEAVIPWVGYYVWIVIEQLFAHTLDLGVYIKITKKILIESGQFTRGCRITDLVKIFEPHELGLREVFVVEFRFQQNVVGGLRKRYF